MKIIIGVIICILVFSVGVIIFQHNSNKSLGAELAELKRSKPKIEIQWGTENNLRDISDEQIETPTFRDKYGSEVSWIIRPTRFNEVMLILKVIEPGPGKLIEITGEASLVPGEKDPEPLYRPDEKRKARVYDEVNVGGITYLKVIQERKSLDPKQTFWDKTYRYVKKTPKNSR